MIKRTKKQITNLSLPLLSVLILQCCSTAKPIPSIARKKDNYPENLGNFDQKPYPNKASVISNMISVLKPELNKDKRDTFASQISNAIKEHHVEPQIVVAIIDTESSFKADKVSRTGDISAAQINVEVWNKEFVRMKKPKMVKAKIKTDQQYALLKMTEILNILKKRYGKTDRRWYARYHSNTHAHKKEYLQKLEVRMQLLANANNLTYKLAQK